MSATDSVTASPSQALKPGEAPSADEVAGEAAGDAVVEAVVEATDEGLTAPGAGSQTMASVGSMTSAE